LILQHKKILLGISGSIAAYKVPLLIRLLVKAGAEVKVITTTAALDFVTKLTLATLSKNEVYHSFTDDSTGSWHNHVELGLWADALVIAPATAHTLSKCANGTCNDLLTATYLSARCPVLFAPAMDLDMYVHGSTLANITKLQSFGNQILKAGYGELASGLVGDGRMAEPEQILAAIESQLGQIPELKNKNILITAGPTQEAIDPVRYISNHSSGKMGLAIAERLAAAGANVTLVCGKIHLHIQNPSIKKINVLSAADMYQAVNEHFAAMDIVIFAAAVADYTPKTVADKKIKKKEDSFSIELTKTVDLAATFGKLKTKQQKIVGFALETDNELANALDKMQRKNFDMIVLNSMNSKGAGFGYDTNQISILKPDGSIKHYELKSKNEVANDIVEEIKVFYQL
jgi:phosphopantothenoylcysteine decarboxylase / phosphopantothenate---cysteine ligase